MPEPLHSANRGATGPGGPRGGVIAAFGVYLFLLGWIVLFKLDLPWIGGAERVVKLVPFAATAEEGASAPAEVAVNLLLFVPFGAYLGLVAPGWRWLRVGAVVAGASVLLETMQWILAVGSSDVTDVIVNTAGGLAGFALLALARRRLRETASVIVGRLCVVVTAAAVVAAGLFIASPVHFGHPPGPGLGPVPGHSAYVHRDGG